jgi:hypothetical protein
MYTIGGIELKNFVMYVAALPILALHPMNSPRGTATATARIKPFSVVPSELSILKAHLEQR